MFGFIRNLRGFLEVLSVFALQGGLDMFRQTMLFGHFRRFEIHDAVVAEATSSHLS